MATNPASRPLPEHVHGFVNDRATAYLAVHRPDGHLSVTPMAVRLEDGHLWLSTTKDRRKYSALVADSRVTVCVADRNNPNRYVEVRGRAVIAEDVDRMFINSIAQAYMGVASYPFDRPEQERVTVQVIAEQVSSPRIPLAEDPPNAPDTVA